MKVIGFILCFLTVSFGSHAQVGFLNKRFTATLGFEFSPFHINRLQDEMNTKYGSMFSIRPTADLGIVLSNRWQFRMNASFHPLRDASYIEVYNGPIYYTYFSEYEQVKTDTVNIESSFTEIGGSLRFHLEYAPVGNYIEFGAGVKMYTSSIQQLKYTILTHYDFDIESTISEFRPVEKVKLNYAFLSIGYGRSLLLKRNLIIDYGIRTVIDLGFINKFNLQGNYEFQENDISSLIKQVAVANAKSNNLINAYVKIGWCK